MIFRCAKFEVDLSKARVMGIVNVTPDSFSDGGQFVHAKKAIMHGLQLTEQGADFLDIGGESTRPNAKPINLQEELDRVMPVVEGLASKIDIPISIDTYKPAVMAQAASVGASMVNDVRALQEEALDVVSQIDVGVCLMHMQGTPQTMQDKPQYDDVVAQVMTFLEKRMAACIEAGIEKERIVLDPGFGFGKTRMHNISLMQQLSTLSALERPLLVGLSRKSVLGQVTGRDVNARLNASVAAAVIAAIKGAKIVRVHDVAATVEALKVVHAISE